MHSLHRRDLNDSFSYNERLGIFKSQLVAGVQNDEAVLLYPTLSPRARASSPRAASAAKVQSDRIRYMRSTFEQAAAEGPADLLGLSGHKKLPNLSYRPASPRRIVQPDQQWASKQSIHSRRGRPLTGRTRKHLHVTYSEQGNSTARQHPLGNWEPDSCYNNQEAVNTSEQEETENHRIVRSLDLSKEPHLLLQLLRKHSQLITRGMLDQIHVEGAGEVEAGSTELAPGHALSLAMKEQLCNSLFIAKTRHNASNRRFKLLLAERESDILTKDEHIQKLSSQLERRSTELRMAKIAIHHLQQKPNPDVDENGED